MMIQQRYYDDSDTKVMDSLLVPSPQYKAPFQVSQDSACRPAGMIALLFSPIILQ